MIIKASTRGNPTALARHLLNDRDNDQIEQHDVRGFMAEDVMAAMREQQAMDQGVKSRQTLFSVSLSPPQDQSVDVAVFEKAIAGIELSVGLKDQPRVVIFHEKEGRRHAHAVWSRIDAERMTVIPLPFYKQRLMAISKDIYLEQGWKLPQGYIDRTERDPRNFDLTLYQQAKREGIDPKQLKLMAKEAWALSDNRASFEQALEARGLYLAKGDRRSHVAMTWRGEVIALSRLLDRKSKEVRERLGSAEDLRSLDDTRAHVAEHIAPTLQKLIGEADRQKAERLAPLDAQRMAMKIDHAEERQRHDAALRQRLEDEQRQRGERMRHGLAGVLDRITGRYAKLRTENEREAWAALQRDREQRQRLVDAQLAERRELQQRIVNVRKDHGNRVVELHRDLAAQLSSDRSGVRDARRAWLEAQQRREADDRREWLDQQQRIRDQEREQWLASQQSNTRQAAPDREGRLSWLFEQQQRPADRDTKDAQRGSEPDFNRHQDHGLDIER
ncbi:relaxase/mobilization nuclease domain-containing protein [Sphingobium sp. MK2]|uniref:relaxase/mobilization nuclease domain-containing protein n=1 Tax=Sphingobium sp. MK2 TaxID=3116540 RepID=UPI0032E3589B